MQVFILGISFCIVSDSDFVVIDLLDEFVSEGVSNFVVCKDCECVRFRRVSAGVRCITLDKDAGQSVNGAGFGNGFADVEDFHVRHPF